jgi:predicted acylesterase/phospholipase RssA
MRMQTFADRHDNARMLRREYTPTQRLARLFGEHFYDPLSAGSHPVRLGDLSIAVAGQPLEVKAPRLILNATVLNTGSLWQFTDSGLGEVMSTYEQHADGNPRWLSFTDQAPRAERDSGLAAIRLGEAVAASCCVPGLFEPLELRGPFGLQGEELTVSLVDGGVFDNQGLVSLLDAGCTHVICSDATDLLRRQERPSHGVLSVAMRANEILMDRVRSKVLDRLGRLGSGRYHLIHTADQAASRIFPAEPERVMTALARIRTDLDSFTDLEAASLIYFGYGLAGLRLATAAAEPGGDLPAPVRRRRVAWRFMVIPRLLEDPVRRERLLRHLEVGSKQLFKVFLLGEPLPWLIVIAPLLLPVALIVVGFYLLPPLPGWLWGVVALLALSLLAYSQNSRIVRWMDSIDWLRRARARLAHSMAPLGVSSLIGLGGAIVTAIHLRIFDRLFLRYGRLPSATVEPEADDRVP